MQASYYQTEKNTRAGQTIECDLCIYAANSAGIIAAIEARRRGLNVVLLNNGTHLGGLTTGGLGYTDFGDKRTIGGLARDFYRRLGSHYGMDEAWKFEPSAASQIYRDYLREAGVEPIQRQFLAVSPSPSAAYDDGAVTISPDKRIQTIRLESGLIVKAAYYMDCSYEGDLMAATGVPYTVGREDNATYGEFFNGVQLREHHQFEIPVSPWVREGDPASGLLPGISPEPLGRIGSGDRSIQAYNFRLCLTRDPRIRVSIPKPAAYDPKHYELLARYLRGGWRDVFFKHDSIPGGKTDTNNHGAFSTDYIGQNHAYPEASYTQREEIFQQHVQHHLGLFWFYANDPRVPVDIQARAREWGLASDEFTNTGHWSPQLYIREARRMVSDYVFTELDCRGYRRAEDPIGCGSYGMDSHNCRRVVINGRVFNEGDVQHWYCIRPYPISYRSVVPPKGDIANLFVPVCLSSSHIAYGSARMEPVFMLLGQSCATATGLCLQASRKSGTPLAVQDLSYVSLARELEQLGQILQPPPGHRRTDENNEEAPVPNAPIPLPRYEKSGQLCAT